VTVPIELLYKPSGRIVFVRSLQCWDPPDSSTEVSGTDKERIGRDFATYFGYLGIGCELA